MLLGRRRPLARAAVVGGIAYSAGKNRARNEEANYDQAYQDGQMASAQAQPAEPKSNPYEELEKLSKLREQGILSDEEFEVEKARVLRSL